MVQIPADVHVKEMLAAEADQKENDGLQVSSGGYGIKFVCKARERNLCYIRAETEITLQVPGAVSCFLDATKLGRPALDQLVTGIYDHTTKQATILPIAVMGGGKGRGKQTLEFLKGG